jgi:hypothetical protein
MPTGLTVGDVNSLKKLYTVVVEPVKNPATVINCLLALATNKFTPSLNIVPLIFSVKTGVVIKGFSP